MDELRPRTTIRSVIAILCAAAVLAGVAPGPVPRAAAADWETWPKKPELPPDLTPKPDTKAIEPDRTVDVAQPEPAKKSSSGKRWWLAAGAAVAIGVVIAVAAGGGGGGGGDTTTNPGHY
jgi:hypothetical protein